MRPHDERSRSDQGHNLSLDRRRHARLSAAIVALPTTTKEVSLARGASDEAMLGWCGGRPVAAHASMNCDHPSELRCSLLREGNTSHWALRHGETGDQLASDAIHSATPFAHV